MLTRLALLLVAALAVVVMHGPPARAQALRTWVAHDGDDVNPCSATAPCKTFAGAISKTAPGGQITALNPGGYGSVTITKSISLEARGTGGGVVTQGTNGIVIAAGPNDVVHIDGLIIDGAGSSLTGVSVISGSTVLLSECVIRNYRGNPGLGISIAPTASTTVVITDCAVTGNGVGISVTPNGGAAQVILDRVSVNGNAGSGVLADGQSAVVRLNASTISGNATGLAAANGGSILSFGNNAVSGNTTDGAPTGTLQAK
jgi:hypothetical protein